MGADPASPPEPHYVLRERHSVALFDEGDDGHNVLVLTGIDVVVPIEMDLDGDPMQDDSASLRSVHGLYEHVLTVGDPDVLPDPDRHLVFYRFRHVPPGLYRIAVRIGDAWVPIGTQLTVRKGGVHWNGTQIDGAPPSVTASQDDGRVDELDCTRDEREALPCGGGYLEDAP